MSDQKEQARWYAKGYAAGRRRKAADVRAQRDYAAREAFRRRVFLAALPACITNGNQWKDAKGENYGPLPRCVELAWEMANEALIRAGL